MEKIKIKCNGCLKVYEVERTSELLDATKSLSCNWCPICEGNATEEYFEKQNEYEIPEEPNPNQLNIF
jgi:hypothetical protein